jgi:hypothetical protein
VETQELLERIGFLFLDLLTPNLVSKLPNYSPDSNFPINKVKNRGKFLLFLVYLVPARV